MASGFNNLLSFKNAPAVSPVVERFLHQLLAIELTEDQRAVAVCALRGIGDAASVDIVAALPPFTGCYAGLEASAARQIRKRMWRAVAGRA
jgi:hypothetical protein